MNLKGDFNLKLLGNYYIYQFRNENKFNLWKIVIFQNSTSKSFNYNLENKVDFQNILNEVKYLGLNLNIRIRYF